MLCSLEQLQPGCEAVVIHIDAREALRSRLGDFGFVPGTRVRCCYRGPGGRVTALKCRGSVIAVRTGELKKIRVRLDG